MNRITKRTWIVGVFLMILLVGLLVFVGEYITEAEQWVSFSGSPHLYNSSNIGCGTITDRSGQMLLDISQGRTYSDDVNTRKSTLHWLGDKKGFISASTVSTYAASMAYSTRKKDRPPSKIAASSSTAVALPAILFILIPPSS